MKLLFATLVWLNFSVGSEKIKDYEDSKILKLYTSTNAQFIATSNLLDASINSLNSLNSLIKKENYRNKITAFNNPTTSDMGFSLETEIQNAIKPILEKAKNTNTNKFSAVVSSLVNNPVKNQLGKTAFGTASIFSSLISLVGNLTITEKKVTSQDMDAFLTSMSKYFVQYEKLNQANHSFDENIDKYAFKLQELQFDTREYMLDLVTILYKNTNRQELKKKSLEELLLKYLDKDLIQASLIGGNDSLKYPGDGIKTAKEIVNGIEKLFNEYQKIYTQNYNEIKAILLQSKDLGKNINTKQVDASVLELQQLYNESKDADILNLRMTTLAERLKVLVKTEQMK